MRRAVRKLSAMVRPRSESDKKLHSAFSTLLGKTPKNLDLYKLALTHSSSGSRIRDGVSESNERLEFLGDAILSAVVADYLFMKYPYKDEGFLTEIRSRLVSRESLNNLGKKLGVVQLMKIEGGINQKQIYSSIFGNTLEAILGSVYLDFGYKFCYNFIVKKLIVPNFDLELIVNSTRNFKSQLVEWGQSSNVAVTFEIIEVKSNKNFKEFTAQVFIDDKPHEIGFGHNKKKAEQDAAFKTLESLKIK